MRGGKELVKGEVATETGRVYRVSSFVDPNAVRVINMKFWKELIANFPSLKIEYLI